ncbi:hypothetical protein BC826DRAFT_1066953 [Russula brevipes]|nr:hypothetical protein BC826DRAFT_1066953 [Russula brevipes]
MTSFLAFINFPACPPSFKSSTFNFDSSLAVLLQPSRCAPSQPRSRQLISSPIPSSFPAFPTLSDLLSQTLGSLLRPSDNSRPDCRVERVLGHIHDELGVGELVVRNGAGVVLVVSRGNSVDKWRLPVSDEHASERQHAWARGRVQDERERPRQGHDKGRNNMTKEGRSQE